jgi:probable phosphoglycerate mutase
MSSRAADPPGAAGTTSAVDAPGPAAADRTATAGPAPLADAHCLVLARHGETEWSRSGRHTGTTDVALTDRGRRQAAHLGHVLQDRRFALVLVSPRRRALETCRLAGFPLPSDGTASRAGRPSAEITADLAEWNYGDYEGRTTDDIRRRRPGWLLWRDGVPGGETAAAVARRADRVIERARSAGGDTIAFGHGHLLRVLAARWLGLDPSLGGHLALDAGSLSVLGWEREVPVLEHWNETFELAALDGRADPCASPAPAASAPPAATAPPPASTASTAGAASG